MNHGATKSSTVHKVHEDGPPLPAAALLRIDSPARVPVLIGRTSYQVCQSAGLCLSIRVYPWLYYNKICPIARESYRKSDASALIHGML